MDFRDQESMFGLQLDNSIQVFMEATLQWSVTKAERRWVESLLDSTVSLL